MFHNMKRIDIEVQQIAKRQHGVVSWHQVHALGVTRLQLWRRVKSGEWVRELPGVWRLSWAQPTWMQRVWCASLWGGSGAFISHRAAAALWELDGIKLQEIELSALRRLRTTVLWVVPHESAFIPKLMQRTRNGVALTSPSRTLVDLAGVVDDETLERTLEHAIRRGIVSVAEIRRILRLLPARGRAGTGKLAQLLEGGVWSAGAQSELERQALRLFQRFGLPAPECQYTIFEGQRRLGIVDFAWPRAKVIVEAEGFQFHAGRKAWESDISRYNELVVYRWTVLRLTRADLQVRAEQFARSLATAIASRTQ